ncbi:MAG TPA: CoA-binding protein [Gemmataceae bacterium]|nr:CoA-binding protein [Gemmataceae bacterium]
MASRPTIAVVGASRDRRKFGNKCVRAYAAAGYIVYPVHPHAAQIEGHQAWPTLADVPADELDMVSVYLPAETCLKVLPDFGRKPAKEVWFNPGADDPAVLEQARALGLNVVAGCSIVAIGANPHQL